MRVAVAVIIDEQQRLLITQRSARKSHGGFWEFPGGKLEEGEEPQQALQREILEEVGLEVLDSHYLQEITHCYDGKPVTLLLFLVTRFSGIAYCREDQMDLRWIKRTEYHNYQFPAANQQIIAIVEKEYFSNLEM